MTCDVAIAGGGIGGGVLALLLARGGLRARLIGMFPRLLRHPWFAARVLRRIAHNFLE